MSTETDLSLYRLSEAERCLKTAKLAYSDEDYKGRANRSYYCIFNCMRGVLALEPIDFKSHSAVISYFRKNYIKTEMFDKEMSKIISDLFELRTDSDYGDFYIVSKEDITIQLTNAEKFLERVKAYLK